MNDFHGKAGVALVSGGTGGIGAAVCRMLSDRGSAVALTYRADATAAERLVDELTAAGAPVSAHRADLTDPAAAKSVVDAVLDRRGGIHTLIHAAGPLVPQRHLSTVAPEEFGTRLEAEAAAFFNLVAPALSALRERHGSIVAVTTAATNRFPMRDGLSSGPKGAVEATARALAAEEGRYGVRVNCVGPGMLNDGMSAQLQDSAELDQRALDAAMRNIPLRTFGEARDIAEAVCFLASDRANFISGQKLDVDGGYGV